MQKQEKILIVDDDPTIVKFLTEVLGEEYQLKAVSSGVAALEIISGFRPDIVLLDIMLGGMDGYEICEKIRANHELTNVKIIFVSAKVDLNEKLKGYNVGGDDYLTKPFEIDELLAKIKVFARLRPDDDKKTHFSETFDEKQLEIFFKIQRKVSDVLYVKSDSPFCNIITVSKIYSPDRIRITIQALDRIFNGKDLIRVHRSYLVNPKKITSVNLKRNHEYKIDLKGHKNRSISIPVGRSYQQTLKNLMPLLFDQ
ncbi:MAG: response regulator transcription factor [SAR324 cluster bacterium]|nr:response regulator transcription factor [SAR324 cluster bacterium]